MATEFGFAGTGQAIQREGAQERIMRGSEEWDAGAERPAQQGTATDASAVGKDISEFDGAAGGEMLARLHEDANQKH